jgi:acyl carrier protein phosphodiesterase
MNYLGHFYLSGSQPEVIFGNFIGDVIKGSKWKAYPESIQKGILLHRFIDDFTDNHPDTQLAKDRIRSHFSITSSIVVDMYFDHFLSLHWRQYHHQTLLEFSRKTFDRLKLFEMDMPSYTGILFQKMRDENWLSSYKSIEGIAFALSRMGKRVKFDNNWEMAEEVLKENYFMLEQDFHRFFPSLILQVNKKYGIKIDETY